MTTLWSFLLTPAGIAIFVSAVFAVTASILMAALYARRAADEAHAEHLQESDIVLTGELLVLIQQDVSSPADLALPSIEGDQLHRVFSHLLQLVRGDDKDRLLALADAMGLPDAAIARMTDRLPARRVDGMHVLEQFPVPRAVDALIERMGNDPEDAVRLEAAAVLARIGKLPPPDRTVDMLDLRHKPANRLHEAIFRASAVTGASGLIALSTDPSLARIRPLLVEALGWSNDFSVLPILAQHANSHDPEVRSASLKAARRLGHPDVETWVLPLLLDPADQVRTQAARTSGQLGLRDAVPVLMTLVENPSWWVRMRATEALAMLRPAQPAPVSAAGLRK